MQSFNKATLGGGCFWCTEAVFQKLIGVNEVVPGYAGGKLANPTYQDICSKTSGHAEVIQVEYDPAVISFEELLEVFWTIHDPTTLNRQGNDVGPQYRSIILYHDDDQRKKAFLSKQQVAIQIYDDPITTEIVPLETFYLAEDYHHDYYLRNSFQPYCSVVINPKLSKFRKRFAHKIKSSTINE